MCVRIIYFTQTALHVHQDVSKNLIIFHCGSFFRWCCCNVYRDPCATFCVAIAHLGFRMLVKTDTVCCGEIELVYMEVCVCQYQYE